MENLEVTLTEQDLVPSLRFSEYSDGWQTKKLEDVAVFLDGKRKPIKSGDRATMRGAIPYYGASGIIDYVNNYIFDEDIVLLGEDGENIVSRNLPLAFKVTGKCWVNNHAHVLRPKDNIDIDFLTHILELVNYSGYNTGTAQPKLNQEVCRSIPLKIPSLAEQQKIASFLSAVDEKKQLLKRKKELLEQYKKGVMQKLYSGQLRFKDENGKDYPDWEEKKLGQVCEINPRSKTLPDSFTYVDLESVEKGKLIKETVISKSEAPSRAQRVLQKNDILYQTVRPYQKNNFLFNEEGVYVASTGYAQIRTNGSVNFLFQLLHFDGFTNQVLDRCTGTSFPAINSKDLSQIKIRIPQLSEQNKIGDFLSTIDRRIDVVSKQISHTQTFKKGLFQQMFV